MHQLSGAKKAAILAEEDKEILFLGNELINNLSKSIT